ncbi:MAG: DUF523 domain-containing protein [Clostridia bacterium]|nr:DUF523 domain-containing protein [Clostridia bacterium]
MLVVSACLAGIPCRMDGKAKPIPAIRKLVEEGKAVTVCPEVLGGLPTPRIPSERSGDRVINRAGEDVTDAFSAGARRALETVREVKAEAVILKARSPSCGIGKIYDGTFTGTLTEGNGVFAEMVCSAGIPVYTEENYMELQI